MSPNSVTHLSEQVLPMSPNTCYLSLRSIHAAPQCGIVMTPVAMARAALWGAALPGCQRQRMSGHEPLIRLMRLAECAAQRFQIIAELGAEFRVLETVLDIGDQIAQLVTAVVAPSFKLIG